MVGIAESSEPERYALKTSRIVKIGKTAQTTVSSCNKKTSGRRDEVVSHCASNVFRIRCIGLYCFVRLCSTERRRGENERGRGEDERQREEREGLPRGESISE